jgi:hypothetical protein
VITISVDRKILTKIAGFFQLETTSKIVTLVPACPSSRLFGGNPLFRQLQPDLERGRRPAATADAAETGQSVKWVSMFPLLSIINVFQLYDKGMTKV